MSAIAAVEVVGAAAPAAGAAVRRLLSRMPGRGTARQGVATFDAVALGHAVGYFETEGSAGQPAASRSGRVTVVLDGRIDNRAEILSMASVRETGQDDARAIADAYAEVGEGVLARLAGDYALLLWDGVSRRLLAVRDVFGMRPLHYCRTRAGWTVASELRALAPEVASRPDEGYTAELLAGRVTSVTATMLDGVQRVPPGSVVELTTTRTQTRRIVVLGGDDPDHRPVKVLHEEFVHLLDQAVRCRLRTSTRVGVMLSGGLDSTTVYLSARAIDGDVDAWTIDQRPESSETAAAAASAAHAGGRHHVAAASARGFDYEDAAAQWMEPPPHPAAANSTGLRQLAAASGTHVLLTGIGADEFFSTNRWHCADVLASGQPTGVLRAWRTYRRAADPASLGALAQATLAPLVPSWARPLARRLSGAGVPPWIAGGLARRVHLDERLRTRVCNTGRSIAERARLTDILGGPSVFANEEADRVATLTGTEDRAPYFDRRLAAFALRLPSEVVDAAPEPKQFVREACSRRLPPHLQRAAAAPQFEYLHADALRRLGGPSWFEGLRLHEAGYLDPVFVRRAVQVTWPSHGAIDERSPFLAALWNIAAAELCLRAATETRPTVPARA